MNEKLGKHAGFGFYGQRSAEFAKLLAGEKQPDAAVFAFSREALIKNIIDKGFRDTGTIIADFAA
ncbi:Uncharacterised protein [Klebsiella grimontii]|uniref:Uncharacterized protein n=1 Tax=Klebsiella grimontii TaxID=2058152 RepID=A0A7H4P2X3_9ENTR|nr:Uncharacterised protein [Klebsiella grimontii]